MPFEQDKDRSYPDRSAGRAGHMAVGEKLRITDANLARLDVTAANLTEARAAMLEEKVRFAVIIDDSVRIIGPA